MISIRPSLTYDSVAQYQALDETFQAILGQSSSTARL